MSCTGTVLQQRFKRAHIRVEKHAVTDTNSGLSRYRRIHAVTVYEELL